MVWLCFGLLVASVSFFIYRQSLPTIRNRFRSKETGSKDGATAPDKKGNRYSANIDGISSIIVQCDSKPPSLPDSATTQAPNTAVPIFNIESNSNDIEDNKTPTQIGHMSPTIQREPSPRPSPCSALQTPGTATMMSPPPSRLKPPTIAAPPRPSTMLAPPRPANSVPLRPPPSAASSLRVPSIKLLSNTSMAPSLLPPNDATSTKPSRKVILEPGHSPLDWANLKASPKNNLRGANLPSHYIRVPPSQLKQQNGRKGRDAWTVWQGKVYNITPYLPFHPGGKGELMRAAGKEAGKLFMEVHPWVNWDGMLSECMVGILVAEGEEKPGRSELEEMD